MMISFYADLEIDYFNLYLYLMLKLNYLISNNYVLNKKLHVSKFIS
jgi:hypothetical protein